MQQRSGVSTFPGRLIGSIALPMAIKVIDFIREKLVMNQGESPPEPPGEGAGTATEPFAHAFIIRIWLEAAPVAGQQAIWRGHITHVASGERRQVQSLCGVQGFLADYLQGMGVRPGLLSYFCRWFGCRAG